MKMMRNVFKLVAEVNSTLDLFVQNSLSTMDVLEHIEDDIGALSQWLTHVKSGGYVLVTTPRSLGPQ